MGGFKSRADNLGGRGFNVQQFEKSFLCYKNILHFLSEALGISFCLFTRLSEWMDVRRVQLILNLASIGFSKISTTPWRQIEVGKGISCSKVPIASLYWKIDARDFYRDKLQGCYRPLSRKFGGWWGGLQNVVFTP